MGKIAVVIPAYEPDERLIQFLKELDQKQIAPVYLVNDGSNSSYDSLFEEASPFVEKSGGKILVHEVNRGKGRALKTAFSYLLENPEDFSGAVVADSDGQHSPDSVQKVINELQDFPNSLILGVRVFDGENVPWKSKFGNKLTEKIFFYVTGVHVTDTQTGLRGIPKEFCRELLDVNGERFEFEMEMLLEAAEHYSIIEVPIETIYDSKVNHKTHFNAVKDSIRIYRILGRKFFRFLFSSLSSSVLDLALFSVFCFFLQKHNPAGYAGIATVAARCISALYNYMINYTVVFKSHANIYQASIRYIILAVIQMSCSAAAITAMVCLFADGPVLLFKIIIDTLLFMVSYKIQQKVVFR